MIIKKPKKKIQKEKIEEPKKEIEIKKEEWFEKEGELVVDVYQKNGEIFIEAPVGGVKPEELDITIEGDRIKIKGKRENPQKIEEKKYILRECYWGPFSKEIILPFELDGSKTEASMKGGILVIKLPIIEKKKRKIKVKEEKD